MSPNDLPLPIFSPTDRIKQLNNIDNVKSKQTLVLKNAY